MKTDKLVDKILTAFQNNRGKASLYCFDSNATNLIIINTIKMFHAKHANKQILIIVDKFDTRIAIKSYLTKNGVSENTGYDIKILSVEYIKLQYNYIQELIITVGVNSELEVISYFSSHCKFVFVILTKNLMNHEFITNIRNMLPDITIDDFTVAVKSDYVYSPVEERRVKIYLDDEDFNNYRKYDAYIDKCVSVFGDITTIEKCKYGDKYNNISAQEVRYNLAVANGWNENLDTTIPFQKEIDEYYNPNALNEYATNFYSMTKNRKDFVTDYYRKLAKINDIVSEHKDKQILIVSLRGEFAAAITEYINQHNDDVKCGDYHDCLDNAYAYDEYGEPILIKSGAAKGHHKMIGAQAQSTLNERRFNAKSINVLSIKNYADTKLAIACDVVIFTTPMCSSIHSLKLRFNKSEICLNKPCLTYILYSVGTIEEKKIDSLGSEKLIKNIVLIDDRKDDYEENNGVVIL